MNSELISGIEKIRSIVSEARGIEIWPYSNDELVQLTYDIQKALVDADSQFMRGHTKGVEDGIAAEKRHQQHVINLRRGGISHHGV